MNDSSLITVEIELRDPLYINIDDDLIKNELTV